jgi:hypothetical protein
LRERSRITPLCPYRGLTLARTKLGPKPGAVFAELAVLLSGCVLFSGAAEKAACAAANSPHQPVQVIEHETHTPAHCRLDETGGLSP